MALTNAQALLLSNDQLLAGLLEDEPNRLQFLEMFPYHRVNGDSLRVSRSSAANFGAEGTADSGNVAPSVSQAVPANVSFQLTGLVQDFTVAQLHDLSFSNVNSQSQLQITAAIRRVLYKFARLFIQGDTATAGEFDGLRKLVTAGQTIQVAAGTGLKLTHMQDLVTKIKANNGREHVFFASTTGISKLKESYWKSGIDPAVVTLNAPDSNGGTKRRECLAFDGAPVLNIEDTFQPNNESYSTVTAGTSIWAAVLGPTGLHGIVPESLGERFIRIRRVLESTAATRLRVYWPVSLVLQTTTALARLQFDSSLAAQAV